MNGENLTLLTGILGVFAEDLVFCVCICLLLHPKGGRKIFFLPMVATILFSPLIVYFWYLQNAELSIISAICAESVKFAVVWCCFEGKLSVNQFYSAALFQLTALGSGVVMLIYGLFGGSNDVLVASAPEQLPRFFLVTGIYVVIDAIIGHFAVRILPKMARFRAVVWCGLAFWAIGMLLLPLIAGTTLILRVQNNAANNSGIIFLVGIASAIFGGATFFVFLKTVYDSRKQRQTARENEMLHQQIALQYDHFLAMQSRDEALYKLQHDHVNHLETIQGLLETQTAAAVADYVGTLTQRKVAPAQALCGHIITNAVLSSKQDICAEFGIAATYNVFLPAELKISDIDMMCVISNLIDNAITACKKLPEAERSIAFAAKVQGGMVVIKVENTGSLTKEKRQSEAHGWGLKILREICGRYDGEMRISAENNKVTTLLLLQNTA